MSGWQAGDLAVCISDDPCPVFGPVAFKKGAIYKVKAVKTAACRKTGFWATGLRMDRDNPTHGEKVLWSNEIRFRKVFPADPAFAEQMRSLKPRVDA